MHAGLNSISCIVFVIRGLAAKILKASYYEDNESIAHKMLFSVHVAKEAIPSRLRGNVSPLNTFGLAAIVLTPSNNHAYGRAKGHYTKQHSN